MQKSDLKIVFMGTPEFAVPSLDILYQSGYNIVGVITAPDRASGRGRKVKYSAVKQYALDHSFKLLQPEKLKNTEFLNDLKALKADLQVVVAFRMLPMQVWDMPDLGTFNLHASLLPQYRGAAPINHALINGEKTTGLTTFFLDEKIDTGRVIKQLSCKIGLNTDFGQLHNQLMELGASLVLKTVEMIHTGSVEAFSQDSFYDEESMLKPAPKIQKADCQINWSKPVEEIHNFIRGLSPVPGAFSFLYDENGDKTYIKILKSEIETSEEDIIPGKIITDQKTFLKVSVPGGFLIINELQIEGKKKMKTADLLRGFTFSPSAYFK